MQNTKLPSRTGFMQPARHGQRTIPLRQGGDVPVVSALRSIAPPVASASDTHSQPLPGKREPASRGGRSFPFILVIDDSPTIRKMIEKMLCHKGSVKTFPDGLAALQWLIEGNGPLPQLILLDIELPKMDGYAIARALKAKPALADTTIIMMSSHDRVVDRIKGQLVGAKGYLPKPFTVEELVRTIGTYLPHETAKRCGTAFDS